MVDYPNRSAQEAALSAVNLAPVASPSEHSPPPEPSEAESLTRTHGLLILERTPDGVPSWLACKFCPIFGCKNKNKQYLKLFRIPDKFNIRSIETHLNREHHEQWEQFKDLDEQKKKEFFLGKTLPAPQRFRKRMDELQKAWGNVKSKKAKKRVRNRDALAESSQRSAKRIKLERFANISALPTLSLSTPSLPALSLLSHQGDWIGRTAFQSTETQSAQPANGQLPHKPHTAAKYIPRRYATLPGKNVYQHLRAILQRYSEPFSQHIQQAVNQTLVEPDVQEGSLTPVWNDVDKADFAARILFYLLRGIPADVTAILLKESSRHPRKERVHGMEKPAALKTHHPDMPEENDEENVNGNQMDASEPANVQELEASLQPEQKDALQISEHVETSSGIPNWKELVRSTANSVSIASMIALNRILSNRQFWAFVIITRPCPVRKDAVEVLIPLPPVSSAPNSVMLITPSPRAVPVDEIEDHTKGSSAEPNGADTGNTADVQHLAQTHMRKEATNAISLIFSHWLVSDSTRNMKPDCGEEGINEWVYERIKMCLRHALNFLIESGGVSKARERVSAERKNKSIYKDWIFATPTDDASVELARSIYSKNGAGLQRCDWALEKRVIVGLITCYQKALAFTPIVTFSSTLIYATAVLRKALTNFEKLLSVTRIVPRAPVEPLHVVSVREGNHAVETVIGLLDVVYPQWSSRLIGVRSEISSSAGGKGLEKELVQALQERRGEELIMVDESIPEDERPIYPSSLAKMTQDDFRQFVDSYIKEPATLEEKFVQNVLNQHEVVCLKEVAANGLNKSWTGYEDMTQLITFVRGLELLWNREPDSIREHRFAGLVYDDGEDCEVVDRNVEHMFNARTLIEVEQTEKLDEEGGRPQAGDVCLQDFLIRWGEDWSNLLTVIAG